MEPVTAPLGAPPLRLVVDGKTVRLLDEAVTLGSAPDADLRLADPAVSGRHLRAARRGPWVELTDLESTNGTWLGPHRLRGRVVAPPGIELRLGRTRLQVFGLDAAPLRPWPEDRWRGVFGGAPSMRLAFAALEASLGRSLVLEGPWGVGKAEVAAAWAGAGARAVRCAEVDAATFAAAWAAPGPLILLDLDRLPPSSWTAVTEPRAETVATCEDADRAVAQGRLPARALTRLGVHRVRLPPLAERQEDLGALAASMLAALGAPMELPPRWVEARLAGHPWPGNLDELRHVLARAVALAPPGVRDAAALPLLFATAPALPAPVPLFEDLPYHAARARLLALWEMAYLRARCAEGADAAAALELAPAEAAALLRAHGFAAAPVESGPFDPHGGLDPVRQR